MREFLASNEGKTNAVGRSNNGQAGILVAIAAEKPCLPLREACLEHARHAIYIPVWNFVRKEVKGANLGGPAVVERLLSGGRR